MWNQIFISSCVFSHSLIPLLRMDDQNSMKTRPLDKFSLTFLKNTFLKFSYGFPTFYPISFHSIWNFRKTNKNHYFALPSWMAVFFNFHFNHWCSALHLRKHVAQSYFPSWRLGKTSNMDPCTDLRIWSVLSATQWCLKLGEGPRKQNIVIIIKLTLRADE